MAKTKTNKLRFPENDMDELSSDLGGGDLAIHDNYQKFDVTIKAAEISKAAKGMINNMLELYLDKSIIDDKEYVKSIATLETMSLQSLMFNVQASEHVLATLLRQLDSGGYVNPDIYKTISEIQRESIEITLKVSQYVRNIPEFFKYLKNDVMKYDNVIELSSKVSEQNQEMSNGYSTTEANRGTKNFVQTVRLQIEAAQKAALEEAEARKLQPSETEAIQIFPDIEEAVIEPDFFSDEDETSEDDDDT